MSFFYHNKKEQEIWISTKADISDFKEIGFATVMVKKLFYKSFFKLMRLDAGNFSLEDENNCIVFDSKIIKPPCFFCNNNLSRIFSDKDCQPCKFQLNIATSNSKFPFETDKLESYLFEKGYIRTTEKFFLKSLN